MIDINDFISNIPSFLQIEKYDCPWEITANIKEIIEGIIPNLGADFKVENGIAIHKSAVLENGVTLKSPMIIMDKCIIGANAYFREGVFVRSMSKLMLLLLSLVSMSNCFMKLLNVLRSSFMSSCSVPYIAIVSFTNPLTAFIRSCIVLVVSSAVTLRSRAFILLCQFL